MQGRIESQAEPIPGYRLVERLGGGGFGEVWKAEAPGGLLKAIKFVYGDLQTVGDSDTARAEQELKALSRVKAVRHPFILTIERFDIIDGQLMIVSELADRNLWDRYRECRSQSLPGIPRVELLSFMEEAAEALDHMNLELDLMHLDIKPQNIFLVGNHVKVADFGLVKDLQGLIASVTGGVTPVYAAPETFEGYVGRYSDQYSLAIVYQELLTGHRPFTGSNTRQLILAHLQAEPDLSALPAADRPIIGRALSKNPNERFPNSLELVSRLLAAREGTAKSKYNPELQDTPFGAPDTPVNRPQSDDEDDPLVPPTLAPARTPSRGGSGGAAVKTGPLSDSTTMFGLNEEVGDGALVPALVIGLGRVGRAMLERFRAELRTRVGDPANVPHIRLLALDTDPTPIPVAADAEPLAVDETLLARLNRPSRYLKSSRGALPPLDDWLDSKMLYRIPRELVTNGVRALGRLAFFDNYRAILARLRWDIEQICGKEVLAHAMEKTGLKLRSNWPRVYLLTHLGGGTGSGVFLDLAYVTRRVLRELRVGRQHLTGFFMLPPALEEAAPDLSLANAHAALTELGRFMKPGQAFSACYEARVPPLVDDVPSFSRCMFVAASAQPEEDRLRSVVQQASDWLYRELLTPLGRAAADARGEGDTLETEMKGTRGTAGRNSPYQACATTVMALPRRALLQRLARHVSRRLLEQWGAKSTPQQSADLREQMQQECVSLRIDPQTVITHFLNAAKASLGDAPDVVFQRWFEGMRLMTKHGLPEPKFYRDALNEADRTLGCYDPKASGNVALATTVMGDNPCVLPLALREAADQFVDRVEPNVVRQVLRFLDEPAQRCGTAEAAIDQTIASLEEWLSSLEQQQEQIAARLPGLPGKIRMELAECDRAWNRAHHGNKPTTEQQKVARATLPERIQLFIILRYQHLTLQWAISVYRSLRGRLSDQKKEVAYFRGRLRNLQDAVGEGLDATADPTPPPRTKILLPDNAVRLNDVVEPCLQKLTTEHYAKVDHAVQMAIQEVFGGVQHACSVTGRQHFLRWRDLVLLTAERCLEQEVEFDDVAKILLSQSEDPGAAQEQLSQMHAAADPEFAPGQGCTVREMSFVQTPNTPSGIEVGEAARQAIKGAQVILSASRDEIVCQREIGGLMLTDLPQFGPIGRKAYDAAFAVEHFTPHARQDVPEWAPLKKPEA